EELIAANPMRGKTDLALSLNNLALCYTEKSRYKEAIESFNLAIEIYEEASEEDSLFYLADLSNTLNNLGNVLSDTSLYEEALLNYQKSLQISRKLVKRNPARFEEDLGSSLNNLGILYNKLKRREEALASHEEALEIRKKLARQNPQRYEYELAQSLGNKSIVFKDLKRYSEAQELLTQALSITKRRAKTAPRVFGKLLGDNYFNRGGVYRNSLQLPQAIKAFASADSAYKIASESTLAKVCQIQIRLLSSKDAMAKELESIAVEHLKERRLDSSFIYFKKAAQAYDIIPFDSLDIRAHYDASLIYEQISLYQEDKRQNYLLLKKCIQHREVVFKMYSTNEKVKEKLGDNYFNFSWYALFEKEFEESEQAARKSLELKPESTGVISNLTAALLLQGKYGEAEKLYKKWSKEAWTDDRYETYGDVFLADLKELEVAGIYHSDMEKVYKLLDRK
ncbi:MAG: tetratricopeptide repeat protein, partial [Bacteroidota bacterium]